MSSPLLASCTATRSPTRQRRQWIASLCALTISLTVGCTANEAKRPTSYYPDLTLGSRWEYTFEYTTPPEGPQKGKLLLRADREEIIGGKKYTRWARIYSGLPDLQSEVGYSRVAPDGFYTIYGPDTSGSEVRELPIPVAVGDTWGYTNPNGTSIRYRAEAIEPVPLTTQTYEHGLKVVVVTDPRIPPYREILYYVSGVGMVRSSKKVDGTTAQTMLEKYSPAKFKLNLP